MQRLLIVLFLLGGLAVSCGSGEPNAQAPATNGDSAIVVDSPTPVQSDAAPVAPTPDVPPATAVVVDPTPATTEQADAPTSTTVAPIESATAVPPAVRMIRTGVGSLVDQDLAPLHGLRVGLIAHRASVVDGQSTAQLLHQDPRIELTALFAPEHGLYGTADAGSQVADTQDPVTGAPVFSLYGADRAPTLASLADVDVLIYDLQDVGVRFYTYTSTLGLAMQAAAAADITFVVLDRPNPLGGDTLQGPTLAAGLESFIGMYNVPSAYGLTSGELAGLIQGEGLVSGVADLELIILPLRGWDRSMRWSDTGLPWIPPSPNLPTPDSTLVYPGTVLFEATTVSEGRGTDEPFQLIGAPWIDGVALAKELNARNLRGVTFEATQFTPRSIPGAAESPRYQDQELAGVHIRVIDPAAVAGVSVGLHMLDAVLRQAESQGLNAAAIIDRPGVFDRLAGTSSVRAHLLRGDPVADLLASFLSNHVAFRDLSRGSLLYPTD